MDRSETIARTAAHVRHTLAGDRSGHDWFHIDRVWRTARQIASGEPADSFVVELAALLHDIADWKFHNGDEMAGPRAAREWLTALEVAEPTIDQVCAIIAGLSFKGAGVVTPMATLEGQIVQDADRLDAIGAIGIARAFAYGGHRGRELFNPAHPPELHTSFAAYKSNAGPTINHFFEKLLLLKDRLNTQTARRLAQDRHQFMIDFLAHFFAECGFEAAGSPFET